MDTITDQPTAAATASEALAAPADRAARLSTLAAMLFTGAIFGFFYAWICSTLWGLDAAAPRVAIAAMQAMNASVRNVVFAPAFFGTPLVIGLAAFLAHRAGRRSAAWLLAAGAGIYLIGGIGLTLTVNVPMNEALALVDAHAAGAEQIWAAYSGRWQLFNIIRTFASGLALLLVGVAANRLAAGPSPLR